MRWRLPLGNGKLMTHTTNVASGRVLHLSGIALQVEVGNQINYVPKIFKLSLGHMSNENIYFIYIFYMQSQTVVSFLFLDLL